MTNPFEDSDSAIDNVDDSSTVDSPSYDSAEPAAFDPENNPFADGDTNYISAGVDDTHEVVASEEHLSYVSEDESAAYNSVHVEDESLAYASVPVELDDEHSVDHATYTATTSTPNPTISALPFEPTDHLFHIKVGEAKNTVKGGKQFSLYPIAVRTEDSSYPGTSFEVSRRYSDFEWIHEELEKANPGVIIPPLPQTHGLTQSFTQKQKFNPEFLEHRRRQLEIYLRRLVYNPVIAHSEITINILTKEDTEFAAMKEKAQRPSRVSKWFSKAWTATTSKISGKPIEVDQTFTAREQLHNRIFNELKIITTAMDLQLKRHDDMADHYVGLSSPFRALGDAYSPQGPEGSTPQPTSSFTDGVIAFSDTCLKIGHIYHDQKNTEKYTIADASEDISHRSQSATDAFTRRTNLLSEQQTLQHQISKTEAQTEKMETSQSANKGERITQLHEKRDQHQGALSLANDRFQECSSTLAVEFDRFEYERLSSIKSFLHSYVTTQIELAKKLERQWEDVLASFEQIDIESSANRVSPAYSPNN